MSLSQNKGGVDLKYDPIIKKRFDELAEKARILEQTKPSERSVDLEKYYEWATLVLSLLERVFGKDSPHYVKFEKSYDGFHGLDAQFQKSRGIFNAAKEDYEGGYLLKVRTLISAELLDSVLDQASELLDAGYKDPACVIAGVALENALKELCNKNNVTQGKLDKMNADLYKLGLYNSGMQKQITAWADRRNDAAHGNWDAYTKEDVKNMIEGINRFIAEHLS